MVGFAGVAVLFFNDLLWIDARHHRDTTCSEEIDAEDGGA